MRRAFTLIELLVVVSIIALLIAILLPALGAARDSGRTASCLSNIRQMMVANEMFMQDNDALYTSSYLYPWDSEVYGSKPDSRKYNINGSVRRAMYWATDPVYLDYLQFDDTQVSNVFRTGSSGSELWGAHWPEQFRCPAAPEVDNNFDHHVSYAFNRENGNISYKRDAIRNASEKYAYSDQQNWWTDSDVANYAVYWDVTGEEWYNGGKAGVMYRHSEASNFAFFDSHAESIKKDEAYRAGDNDFNKDRWDPYR